MEMFWTFGVMFMCCHFGEMITNEFDDLSDQIYQSDWDSYPYQVRRLLPIVILAAQEPVHFQTFGRINCTYDTYKKVTSIEKILK